MAKNVEVAAPSNRLLIDVLREELNLTGTKLGCDDGSCGACTILLDNMPVQCCMMLAVSYQGREITTIEGLDQKLSWIRCRKHFVNKVDSNADFVLLE